MKYLLMMSGTKESADWYASWSQEQLRENDAYIGALVKELQDAGVLLAYECLAFPDQARLVRADDHGDPITDGVFPESKEFLAGYWLVDVESADAVYRLAARISAAPGDRIHGNQPIEVRQVLDGTTQEVW